MQINNKNFLLTVIVLLVLIVISIFNLRTFYPTTTVTRSDAYYIWENPELIPIYRNVESKIFCYLLGGQPATIASFGQSKICIKK